MTKPLDESVGGVQGKHNLKISPHSLLINYQGRKVLFNVVFLPEKKINKLTDSNYEGKKVRQIQIVEHSTKQLAWTPKMSMP